MEINRTDMMLYLFSQKEKGLQMDEIILDMLLTECYLMDMKHRTIKVNFEPLEGAEIKGIAKEEKKEKEFLEELDRKEFDKMIKMAEDEGLIPIDFKRPRIDLDEIKNRKKDKDNE